MNYTGLHNELKALFDPEKTEIKLSDGIRIRNIQFTSEICGEGFINPEDPAIKENRTFSYPLFCPAGDSKKVIIMLHGLNERSWEKYLTWAFRLAQSTSSYIILFPISFHINRSPQTWSNPRSMSDYLNHRNSLIGRISNSSFVNIALSNRLTDDPMRFFYSGNQTANDIIRLVSSIRNGTHPEIPEGSTTNIFAYSIGAFLSEILLMGNPGDLFTDSKLFIFCGGSVFSNMNGSSKYIMDKRAFDRVYNYYMNDFEAQAGKKTGLSEFLNTSRIAMAFRSMIDLNRLISFRETILSKLHDQVRVIALEKDKVIPLPGVIETLRPVGKDELITIMDPDYSYSHENPFPVLASPFKEKVDRSFEEVFLRASAFL